MALKIKKTVVELVAEANAEVETVSVADALKLKDDPGVTFVDIRDIRELERDGRIPGAFHAPRGMLEFWVDPASPYYRETFGTGKIADDDIVKLINANFDLRPGAIIRDLNLRRPIYRATAAYGHFGRTDIDAPWENTSRAAILRDGAHLPAL